MTDETILKILKTDLQITAMSYDELLQQQIKLAKEDIKKQGITLEDTDEDGMLVEMYAAWIARKRKENIPMSRMLQRMLHNRLLAEKMKTGEDEE